RGGGRESKMKDTYLEINSLLPRHLCLAIRLVGLLHMFYHYLKRILLVIPIPITLVEILLAPLQCSSFRSPPFFLVRRVFGEYDGHLHLSLERAHPRRRTPVCAVEQGERGLALLSVLLRVLPVLLLRLHALHALRHLPAVALPIRRLQLRQHRSRPLLPPHHPRALHKRARIDGVPRRVSELRELQECGGGGATREGVLEVFEGEVGSLGEGVCGRGRRGRGKGGG
ncbi:hypothetical protein C8R47DRAFT_1120686, partial [Mycena vitilis]